MDGSEDGREGSVFPQYVNTDWRDENKVPTMITVLV